MVQKSFKRKTEEQVYINIFFLDIKITSLIIQLIANPNLRIDPVPELRMLLECTTVNIKKYIYISLFPFL